MQPEAGSAHTVLHYTAGWSALAVKSIWEAHGEEKRRDGGVARHRVVDTKAVEIEVAVRVPRIARRTQTDRQVHKQSRASRT